MIDQLFSVAHPWQVVPSPLGRTFRPGRDIHCRITETPTYWQVENNRTGFRVPKVPSSLGVPPAPIQGIRHADGTWTPPHSEPYLYVSDQVPATAFLPAQTMTVTFAPDNSPLRVQVEVHYTFNLPAFGQAPAGPGYHRTTITLEADSPSLLLEEDSTCDVQWMLNVHAGLAPTRAQYRGHHADRVEWGREVSGIQYRPDHERGGVGDAVIDLAYTHHVRAGLFADDATDPRTRPPLSLWDLWAPNTGRYWLLYSHTAPSTANLAGIFAGRTSRLIGCVAAGVSVINGPGPYAGFEVLVRRHGSTAYSPRSRFQWGLFVSTKGAGLLPQDAYTQPIQQQQNLHAGLDLEKLGGMAADPADPPGGYGATYLPAAVTQRIRDKVRTDPAYYQWLSSAEPSLSPFYAVWRDATPAAAQAMASSTIAEANGVLNEWVNGEGYRAYWLQYWQGGNVTTGLLGKIDELLASPHVSASDRAKLEAAVSLFGSVLWDNDNVPLQRDAQGNLLHGQSLGSPNMPLQYTAQRDAFAIHLGADSAWAARAAAAGNSAVSLLDAAVHPSGAYNANSGYTFTATPNLLTLLRLKRLGDDRWSSPKLAAFGEYVLQLLTPPDVRFGGRRKRVPFGDVRIQGWSMPGVLATGFRGVNDTLAARLMGAWHQLGRYHDSFYGSSVLQIDDEAPQQSPALGSANFDGALTVPRSGYGAADECAVFVRQGTHVIDHSHNERGSVSAWLLKAPVIQDWSSRHTPHVYGSIHHNMLILESMAGEPWDQDGIAFDAGADWPASARVTSSFAGGADERVTVRQGDGTATWDRSVRLVQVAGKPLLSVKDSCTGSSSKLVTWNLMGVAQGITVPSATAPAEPLAGVPVPIAGTNGVHKIAFAGPWGVSFDCYVCYDPAGPPPSARLASWGHGEGEEGEKAEFLAATGQPFEERMQTLRLRSTSSNFHLVIVPYLTGTTPAVTVYRRADGAVVALAGTETVV